MNAERIFRISREISRENLKIMFFPGKFSEKLIQTVNFLENFPGEIDNWFKSRWRCEQELFKKQYICVFSDRCIT